MISGKLFNFTICFCISSNALVLYFMHYKDITKSVLNQRDVIDWHNYTQMYFENIRTGPGEHGEPVIVNLIDSRLQSDVHIGFNTLVSDKISLSRSIKDLRHKSCQKIKYYKVLPQISIIIPFFDEPWTTLVRTFVSAINRAPRHLIKEVILVDDFSQNTILRDQLDNYIKLNYEGVVSIIRTTRMEGLIGAKNIGARHATGDVLVFMEPRCECSTNWLPPLLQPIVDSYRTVVCPFIDIIDHNTFEHKARDEGARGAFDWNFDYKRLPKLRDNKTPTEPFRSPVMSGIAFAISRTWFWELGGFDDALEIWGGDRYELSFKVWQCGGRMLDAPCSRIGQVFNPDCDPCIGPVKGDYLSYNYKRVAEVWMDEYKDIMYKKRGIQKFQNLNIGNISLELQLRKRLQCMPFKWYMTYVAFDILENYPIEERKPLAHGKVQNKKLGLCIYMQYAFQRLIKLHKCATGIDIFQIVDYTWQEDIRSSNLKPSCLDYSAGEKELFMYPCHGKKGNQHWVYNLETKQIINPLSGHCLDADATYNTLKAEVCSFMIETQKWEFEKIHNTTIIDKLYQKSKHGIVHK